MKRYIYYITGIVILVIILLHISTCSKVQLNKQIELTNNLADTIRVKTNKLGQEQSRTSLLETKSASDFLKIKSSDSTILILQGKVKQYKDELKNGGSVTSIGNTTGVNVTGGTTIKYDTIRIGDSIKVFPVYEMDLKNKWYNGKIIAKKDSTNLDIKIENEYTIVIGEEKHGLFKKRTPFVEVTNLNPNTKTKMLKTYQVDNTVKPKRIGLGVIGGYGIGAEGLSPFIGIGISYNLITL